MRAYTFVECAGTVSNDVIREAISRCGQNQITSLASDRRSNIERCEVPADQLQPFN